MKIYHTKKDGSLGVCKARKGNCPLGSLDEHIEAEDFYTANVINMKNLEKEDREKNLNYNLFWTQKDFDKLSIEEKQSLFNKVNDFYLLKNLSEEEGRIFLKKSIKVRNDFYGLVSSEESLDKLNKYFDSSSENGILLKILHNPSCDESLAFKIFEKLDIENIGVWEDLVNHKYFESFRKNILSDENKLLQKLESDEKISVGHFLAGLSSNNLRVFRSAIRRKINHDLFFNKFIISQSNSWVSPYYGKLPDYLMYSPHEIFNEYWTLRRVLENGDKQSQIIAASNTDIPEILTYALQKEDYCSNAALRNKNTSMKIIKDAIKGQTNSKSMSQNFINEVLKRDDLTSDVVEALYDDSRTIMTKVTLLHHKLITPEFKEKALESNPFMKEIFNGGK